MLKRIKSIMGFGDKQSLISLNKILAISDEHDFDQALVDEFVYRYPPFPKGIPAVNIERIIDTNKDLIQQIILARGLAGKHNMEEVDAKIIAPIRHLAGITHLLPATEKEYYRTPGGLFRFCLESSLFGIRYAERKILTRAAPEIRRDNESLWAHASFLAGLFSEAIIVISKLSVYSDDGGIEWHPGTDTLTSWLIENKLRSYHIKWGEVEEPAIILFLAWESIEIEQRHILGKGEKSILMTLASALHEPKNRQNKLADINLEVRTSLIKRDNAADSSRYGRPLSGMHLSPWLIDAMRHLLEKKRWVVNEENGRLWYGNDGVYIVWPLAAEDIKHELKESRCPFVPNTMEILAELMEEAGIIEKISLNRGHLFEIGILQSDSPEKKYLTAVRLTRKEVLFEQSDYKPLDMVLQMIIEVEEDEDKEENISCTEESDHEEIRIDNLKEKSTKENMGAVVVDFDHAASDPDKDLLNEEISLDLFFGKKKDVITTKSNSGKSRVPGSAPSIKKELNKQVEAPQYSDPFETVSETHSSPEYDKDYGMDYQELPVNYDNYPEDINELIVNNENFHNERETVDGENKYIELGDTVQTIKIESTIKGNFPDNIGQSSVIITNAHLSNISDGIIEPSLEIHTTKEWKLPSTALLDIRESKAKGYSDSELNELSGLIKAILKNFGFEVTVVDRHPGPVITLFELELAAGVKVSRVSLLDKDLARGLSVTSVRVVEVIPGKSVIGLEIPNMVREIVWLRELLNSECFRKATSVLTMAVGQDIYGAPLIVDLGKMPHALVAGTTGSGKSVAINTMILSILYKATPDQVKLIMIDPKMLELSVYDGIPHLLLPVVTDMTEAGKALNQAIDEMERRYKVLSKVGGKNLEGFNQIIKNAKLKGESIQNPFFDMDDSVPEAQWLNELPIIVIIIDELADMLMIDKKIEGLIVRLAQKARAAGIHLILATQRPSSDVLTGTIKANIPARFALQVSSRIDSRTILDQSGAESLLGNGDMLYMSPGTSIPVRAHGSYIDDIEIHRVVDFLKNPDKACYQEEVATEVKSPVIKDRTPILSIEKLQFDNQDVAIVEIPETVTAEEKQKLQSNMAGKKEEQEPEPLIVESEVAESSMDMLSGLFGTSSSTKHNAILPSTQVKDEIVDDIDVSKLFGGQKNPNVNNNDVDLKLRKDMLINRLRKIPKQFLESKANGITKVQVKGIQKSKLDIKDCISVLKSSDLLVLVDGFETGCDESGNNKLQYFLVKSDLLNGK